MTTDTTRPDKTLLGVTLIVTAVFLMSVQEALFKLFDNTVSLWQVFTLRGLLAVVLLLVIARVQRQHQGLLSQAVLPWPVLRSTCMTVMFVCMYAALPFISLASVAAGIYTGPVFVTLLSTWVIRESPGVRGWLAILLGFCGVLVVLQPGTDSFSYWMLLPVVGGFFYAVSNIITRARCQSVSMAAISLSLNVALLLTGVLLSIGLLIWQPSGDQVLHYGALFSSWTMLELREWQVIVILALLVVVIGMTLAGAYQAAQPTIVATFDYSYLVFAVLWDFLVFSTPPTVTTIAGAVLIILAGILVVSRPAVQVNTS